MQEFKDHLVPQHYPIYGRVARVANKILRSNADFDQIKDKNWTITVIEDPQRNAFVLPVSIAIKKFNFKKGACHQNEIARN